MVVLGAHVVDPRTADGFALHSSFTSKVVQIGYSSGELGDRCIFVAIHNSFLPEAFLTLREKELGQGFEGVVVHVFGGVGHS